MRGFQSFECSVCRKSLIKRSPSQKYCEPCSEEKHAARQRKWARDNPAPKEKIRAWAAVQKSREIEAGIAISAQNSTTSMAWTSDEGPNLVWLVRTAVPFSYAASKNHIYTMRGSHVALRRESRAMRDEIITSIKNAVGPRILPQGKVWIDLMVEKPDHRGDAINVVDLVCDAIKVAIGIDDRWFSIRRLDWKVVKTSPSILIGIGQENVSPEQICSHCGRSLTFSMFNKKTSNKQGIDRVCRDCRSGRVPPLTESIPHYGKVS